MRFLAIPTSPQPFYYLLTKTSLMRHIIVYLMNPKEKTVYLIGFLLVIVGAYAGRDLTNTNELIEGSAMVALFVSVFIVLFYMNRRGIGDWHRKYT